MYDFDKQVQDSPIFISGEKYCGEALNHCVCGKERQGERREARGFSRRGTRSGRIHGGKEVKVSH